MARILIVLLALVSACTSAETRKLDRLYEKAKFKVGGKEISAYVADDDSRRSQGLMFIEKLPKDTGMLFVFENEQPLGFWMKNTLIPLAIGFFDAKGILIDVQEMRVAETIMDGTPPSYQSKGPALYALEMNAGWFAKNGIKNGSRLELVSTVKSGLLKSKMSKAGKSGQKSGQ